MQSLLPGEDLVACRKMRSLLAGALMLLLVAFVSIELRAQGLAPAAAAAPPTQPALVHHAIVISIDGCRPDVLLRARTPFIHELLSQASFTFYAQTTNLAITLPSHTSMLTGVTPDKHGIFINEDPPEGLYPKVPTLFEIAHDHGLTTGVFSTKSKFSMFTHPTPADDAYISSESSSPDDGLVARKACEAITQHKPGAMLIHLGNNDRVGHLKGWGSPEQMAALETADTCIADVFKALKTAGIDNDTLVIISSDHGGSGLTHGASDPRSRFIPWIAVGPHVRKNYDLTSDRALTVHTEDTFATACYFLGLPLPTNIDGKPVMDIISGRELLAPK